MDRVRVKVMEIVLNACVKDVIKRTVPICQRSSFDSRQRMERIDRWINCSVNSPHRKYLTRWTEAQRVKDILRKLCLPSGIFTSVCCQTSFDSDMCALYCRVTTQLQRNSNGDPVTRDIIWYPQQPGKSEWVRLSFDNVIHVLPHHPHLSSFATRYVVVCTSQLQAKY